MVNTNARLSDDPLFLPVECREFCPTLKAGSLECSDIDECSHNLPYLVCGTVRGFDKTLHNRGYHWTSRLCSA
jgi:hypothetical protein